MRRIEVLTSDLTIGGYKYSFFILFFCIRTVWSVTLWTSLCCSMYLLETKPGFPVHQLRVNDIRLTASYSFLKGFARWLIMRCKVSNIAIEKIRTTNYLWPSFFEIFTLLFFLFICSVCVHPFVKGVVCPVLSLGLSLGLSNLIIDGTGHNWKLRVKCMRLCSDEVF